MRLPLVPGLCPRGSGDGWTPWPAGAAPAVRGVRAGRWFTPTGQPLRPGHRPLNSYSVPDRFIGRQLRVLLHANGLFVSDGRTMVAHHERLGRGEPPGPGPPSGDLQLDA
ncbi:hypothetical protein ACFQ7I_06905 [Streptomyces massasporeus]